VEVVFENGSIVVDVITDEKMTGDITKLSDFKNAQNVYDLFGPARYQTVTMRKV
jgi:NADH-quinone oxidoreductase subunit G